MTVQVNIMILTKILGRLTNQALLVAICLFSPLIHTYEVNMSDSGVKASATALFSGLEESLRTLKGNNQLTLENVKTMLNNQLIPASNTKYFAFKVLGKNLAKLNEEQKIAFIDALTQNLIDSYASILVKYHNEKIIINAPKMQPSGKMANVGIELQNLEKSVKAISTWRFNETSNTWQIFDIVIEGVSLLQSKQAEVGSSISRNGIEGTLEKLNNNNSKSH